VVQNAGGFLLKPFEATEATELDRQLALNLRAPFLLARGLLPAMRAAGGGLFITIGSICDHLGLPDNSAYTASKFGLRGLHEALSAEYRGTGVRFTLVSPGATDTGIWESFDPDARPGFLRRAEMLRPEDVADAVLFAATRPPRMTVEWLRLLPSPTESET
jgi:NAD(P)-dependent dehydrogenase (short-subunit alcohol dehydrogenase family)